MTDEMTPEQSETQEIRVIPGPVQTIDNRDPVIDSNAVSEGAIDISNEITPEQARAIIAQAEREEGEIVQREVNAILEKYNWRIVGIPQLTNDGRIGATAAYIKNPPQG